MILEFNRLFQVDRGRHWEKAIRLNNQLLAEEVSQGHAFNRHVLGEANGVNMAGYVHITNEVGLSMSTISFNAIVEFPRIYFDSSSKGFESEIYEQIDEGKMDFISLIEQDSHGFMTFYKALSLAHDESEKSGRCGNLDEQFFEMVMKTWKELLCLLRNDTRFIANLCP